MDAFKKPELTLHHGGIYVSDFEKSIGWYDDILGFTCVSREDVPIPGGVLTVAFMKRGESIIELFCKPEAAPFDAEGNNSRLGTNHICLSVEPGDFDTAEKYFRAKGVKLVSMLVQHPDEESARRGGDKCMFIEDPDGIQIEIIENVRFRELG